MPQFDLTANAWTEVIAAGGSNPQQIIIGLGEALVSLGVPDALTSAVRLGGASGRSVTEGRMLTVAAGVSVWMRPVGPRVLFYIGQASGVTPTPSPTPTPTPTPSASIGGMVVNAPGAAGTMYEGYTLSGGDDFDTLSLISPANPRNRYGTTRATYMIPEATQAPRGSSGLAGYDWDPSHTGDQDILRGKSLASAQDLITLGSSSVVLKQRIASSAEQAAMKDPTKLLLASMIHTATSMMFRAPGIIECRARHSIASPNAPSGWHATPIWTMMASPVSQSATERETDWEAANNGNAISPRSVRWNSGTGTGDAPPDGVQYNVDLAYHLYTIKFDTDGTIKWFRDGVLSGTLTPSPTIESYDRPIYGLMTNHSYQADIGAGTAWSSLGAAGAAIELDHYRVWRQTGAAHYTPLASQADVSVTPGVAGSVVFPDAAATWGDGTVTETVEGFTTDAHGPGGSYNGGYANLPTGVTYTAGTRTVAWTTELVKPGRVQLVRHAWKVGASCTPQSFALNVAPTINVGDLSGIVGQAFSFDLYAAIDHGNLVTVDAANPKGIVVTGGPAGLAFSASTGLLTLAAQGSAVASTPITITTTNCAGQATSKTVNFAVNSVPAAGTAYTGWSDAIVYDANPLATGTGATSWPASGAAGTFASDLAFSSGTVTAGGPNNKKYVRFSGSGRAFSAAANAATPAPIAQIMAGTTNGPFIMALVWRAVTDATAYVGGWSRTTSSNNSSNTNLLRRATGLQTSVRSRTGATARDTDMGETVFNQWHITLLQRDAAGKVTVFHNSYATKRLDAVTPPSVETIPYAADMLFTLGAAQINGSGTVYQSNGTLDIAKAVVAPIGTHTDGDLQQTVNALAVEFGLPLA